MEFFVFVAFVIAPGYLANYLSEVILAGLAVPVWAAVLEVLWRYTCPVSDTVDEFPG